MCDEFGLDVSRTTLEGLMEFCDVDSNGIVDFVEFSNYLTWREKLPIKPREQQILLTGAAPPHRCHCECAFQEVALDIIVTALVFTSDYFNL